MAYGKKTHGDESFLRQAFDAAYAFNPQKFSQQVRRAITRRTNIRLMGLTLLTLGSLLLLVVAWGMMRAGSDYVGWASMPSVEEQLAAPFNMESRIYPFVGTGENATLPSKMGSFVLDNRYPGNRLLNQCVATMVPGSDNHCKADQIALYTESATYKLPDVGTLTFTMTQFDRINQADDALYTAYQYSRHIGRIGNFSFLDDLRVDYYYSSTRGIFSFTWVNGPWLFTASSNQPTALEKFLETVPY